MGIFFLEYRQPQKKKKNILVSVKLRDSVIL